MGPFDCLRLQMELEGLGPDPHGLLTRLGPDGEVVPLVLLARTSDGRTVTRYGEGLPAEVRKILASREGQFEFPAPEKIVRALRTCGISTRARHYATYTFPQRYALTQVAGVQCLRRDDPRVQEFGFGGLAGQVYAIDSGEGILSACVSSRQNEQCAEAWVFTRPEHRGHGLARRVVAAWASAVMSAGRTPFYSHEIENLASARLAAVLGLVPVFEEVVFERDD